MAMPGHLFLVQGDLTRIRCDAWLLPTDGLFTGIERWVDRIPTGPPPRVPRGWGVSVRTFAWPDALEDQPTPWPTIIGARSAESTWYAEGALEFLRAASREIRSDRKLLALPLVGTGRGGAARRKGGVAATLVSAILAELPHLEADVVLVLRSEADFAACQIARHNSERWDFLRERGLFEQALALAQAANRGQLALFLGAGTSDGAGLPNWEQLIERLAEEAGFDAALREELKKFTYTDRAQIIERELQEVFRERIAAQVQSPQYSLCQALLASLPTREAVTQNYDTLFEEAVRGKGEDISVLPYQPREIHAGC